MSGLLGHQSTPTGSKPRRSSAQFHGGQILRDKNIKNGLEHNLDTAGHARQAELVPPRHHTTTSAFVSLSYLLCRRGRAKGILAPPG